MHTTLIQPQPATRKDILEIRREVAAIKQSWTAGEREKRAALGTIRQLELLDMCGLLESACLGTPSYCEAY